MTYSVTNLTTQTVLRWPSLNPGEPSSGSYPRLMMTDFERAQFKVMERLKITVMRPEGKGCELRIEE